MAFVPPSERLSGLLTPSRVSLMLGLSRWQLNQIVRDGRLKCVWLNKKARRFRPDDVEGYINSLPRQRAA